MRYSAVTLVTTAILAMGIAATPVLGQDDKAADPPKCTEDDIKLMQSKAAPMAEGDAKSKAMSELMRAEKALAAKDMEACAAAMAGATKAMAPAK